MKILLKMQKIFHEKLYLKACLQNASHLFHAPAYYLIENVSLHPVPCLPWSSPNMPCPARNCHIASWSHQDDVLIGAFTNIDDHAVYYHHELLSVCVTLWSPKWSNCITHWGLVICVNTHGGWGIFWLIQILLSHEQLFIDLYKQKQKYYVLVDWVIIGSGNGFFLF